MTASPLKILTPEQLAFYQANEYLLLRNVISPSILDKAERAIQRWVNSLIEDWVREGKLQNTYAELPFQTRLIEAWNAAGKPVYNPNPTLELVSREIYDILREPLFTQIAQDLFDSPDVSASGVFHCRPNLPEQPLTDTPWHQDAQCCPTLAGTKFVVMWIPLVDVDETNACLEGAIGKQHQGKLYRNYKDPHGYYISMRPDDVSRLTNIVTYRMKRGDLLFFNEMLPHRAVPNHSNSIRWSIDLRYYETSSPVVVSPQRSMICSHTNPELTNTSYEDWAKNMHLTQ